MAGMIEAFGMCCGIEESGFREEAAVPLCAATLAGRHSGLRLPARPAAGSPPKRVVAIVGVGGALRSPVACGGDAGWGAVAVSLGGRGDARAVDALRAQDLLFTSTSRGLAARCAVSALDAVHVVGEDPEAALAALGDGSVRVLAFAAGSDSSETGAVPERRDERARQSSRSKRYAFAPPLDESHPDVRADLEGWAPSDGLLEPRTPAGLACTVLWRRPEKEKRALSL